MEDETTKDLSFGEKLDQILNRLSTIEQRLETLETKAYDTRPIWERALAEMLELKNENAEIKTEIRRQGRKFDVFVQHLVSTQADVKELEERLSQLEGNQTQG